jgi:hypothetical protein
MCETALSFYFLVVIVQVSFVCSLSSSVGHRFLDDAVAFFPVFFSFFYIARENESKQQSSIDNHF